MLARNALELLAPHSLLPNHIRARRWLELEGRRVQGHIGLQGAKRHHGPLAKAVEDFQDGQFIGLEPHTHGLQRTVPGPGRRHNPLQPILVGGHSQIKIRLQRLQVCGRGNQCRRRCTQRARLLARRHLVQVGIEQPQSLAIGDDGLLERFFVKKPEAAGPRKLEHARRRPGARGLSLLGGRSDYLDKFGMTGTGIFQEKLQALQACSPRRYCA